MRRLNSYNDYYGYMNYMTGSNDIPNYTGMSNLDMSYQNFDNNSFSNNFMMPTGNNELLEPKEALEKGNLFKNLYVPYKNYKPMELKASSEREKLLNQIRSYAFAMKDLDLYLDVNPNNTSYINLYNEYRKIKENLINQYEKSYGPLTLTSSSLEKNNWVWNNGPWPWEGDK